MPPDAAVALSTLEANLIVSGVSKQTHDSIVAQIEAAKNGEPQVQDNKAGGRKRDKGSRPPDVSTMAGLLLGSPEFQRR
jgi:hypothetical protein